MFNTNWPLNHNTSTSNVDWSALADTWMQQREQQAQWQQGPPPPPPPPPPLPQFLLGGPPIPPPGPPPIGMTFPPLPPAQLGMAQHYHQLQVGSNTTQESLTMTSIENSSWRPQPPLHPLMMPSGPHWRPNTHNNQQLFPVPSEMAPSFSGHNFWPPVSTIQQAPPPPVPPPVPPPPPPVPPQQSQIPPQFPTPSFQHPPVDKRTMHTSFNTSIPSLMDLPSSYRKNSVPPPIPVPAAPKIPIEPSIAPRANIPSGGNANAKRRKIPVWLRDALGRMGKEKEKKMQNTSNNNLSTNESSSKFDDDEDDEDEENERTFNESPTAFSDEDDDDDEERERNEDEEPSSTLVSSTPIVNRRSRFDDDKSTEQQLNVSAISRRTHSPSPPPPTTTTTTTLFEDDQIDKEEQFMMKLRRSLTELLLEVTNEEIALIAKDVYATCKVESSTPVIRKASGLSSLIQAFSGTDSDDEDKDVQSTVDTTVITKSPIRIPVKQDNGKSVSNKSIKKTSDDDNNKSPKSKKKKSTREKSLSSSSSSHDYKTKKHHHKKHRHRSSSSSSNSSQTRSQKKKKSSNHDQYSEHNKSRKYDDRGRKH